MPELDGIELMRRIRNVDKDCAIIVVTNVENDEMMEEVRKIILLVHMMMLLRRLISLFWLTLLG